MYIQPFTTIVDWREIWRLMEVSTMFYIRRYCVFTWDGRLGLPIQSVPENGPKWHVLFTCIGLCGNMVEKREFIWTKMPNERYKRKLLLNMTIRHLLAMIGDILSYQTCRRTHSTATIAVQFLWLLSNIAKYIVLKLKFFVKNKTYQAAF